MDASTAEPEKDLFDQISSTPTDEQKPAPQPELPAPTETDNATPSVMDYAADAAKGVVRGVRGAAHAVGDMLPDAMKDEEFKKGLPEEGAPETGVGHAVAGITQAAIGYAMGGALLKGAGFAAEGVVGAMKASAVGTPMVADVHQERLSNVLMQYPWLQPAASLIAQNPNDPEILARAKATLEDVMTTGAAGAVFSGLRLAYLKATSKTVTPEIAKLEKEVIAEANAPKASVASEASASGSVNPPEGEAAQSAGKTLVLGQGEKPGTTNLFDASPSFKKAPDGTPIKTTQVPVKGLTWDAADHAGPVDPVKVQAIRDQIKSDPSKLPPVAVEKVNGSMKIMDGRHRVAAAEAEGYTSLSGKVYEQVGQPKPVTLAAEDGAPLVTLSPAKSARFTSIMDKLVMTDAAKGTPDLAAGPMAKEGSMNAAHMTADNSTLQTLKELGKLTKTELGKSTPAYRSVDETKALADVMGQDHAELYTNLKASNLALEDIDAVATGARQLLQTKGAELFASARKATLSGDPEAKAAFAEQMTHLSEFQAQLSSLTTRLGRGLRSFGEDVGPFKPEELKKLLADPKEAEKMQRLITATGGDVKQMLAIRKIQDLTWGQKAWGTHNEYWTGLGLLSRGATQVTNFVSTAINSMIMEPAAMMTGGVMRGVTGNGWAEAREAAGIYSGFRTAFFDSMHMAWAAAKSEKAILSQAGTNEQKMPFITALTYNMNPDSYMGKLVDLFGNVTRLSFRGLTAGDEFFKQMSYRAKISATATREAWDMVRAGTLPKDQVSSRVATALQNAIDDTGKGTNEAALKYAEKATFVNDLKGSTWLNATSLGESMASLSSNPMLRGTILPFVKTPTNVTRTTFEYTPVLGQFRRQFFTDLKAGGEKQALAIGKLTLGSGMYIGAMHLVLDDRITGAPPSPGVLMPAGWKPYSVKFKGMGENGGDLYLSYQRMQPFGDILGLSADFAKSSGMIDDKTRDGLASAMSLALARTFSSYDNAEAAGLSVGANLGKSLISKTYFRNLTEFFSTFSGYNNEKSLLGWWQNYAASHVPGALSIGSAFAPDETIREVRSTLDAIMSRIPGLSQKLEPKRDLLGAVHDVKVGQAFSMVNPISGSETKNDSVMNELSRLSNDPHVKMVFSEAPSKMTVGGQAVDLKTVTSDKGQTAYDRMGELMQTVKAPGETKNLHDKLVEIMHDPRYQIGKENPLLDGSPLYPGVRQNMIRVALDAYRTAAADKMKDEFASKLGIKNALMSNIDEKVARQSVKVGIADKLFKIAKDN